MDIRLIRKPVLVIDIIMAFIIEILFYNTFSFKIVNSLSLFFCLFNGNIYEHKMLLVIFCRAGNTIHSASYSVKTRRQTLNKNCDLINHTKIPSRNNDYVCTLVQSKRRQCVFSLARITLRVSYGSGTFESPVLHRTAFKYSAYKIHIKYM